MEDTPIGCLQCYKEIERKTPLGKRKKYCSVTCSVDSRRKEYVAKVCGYCQKGYTVMPGMDRFSRYCNLICYRRHLSKPGQFVQAVCEKCQEPFKGWQPNHIPTIRFCSIKCSKEE